MSARLPAGAQQKREKDASWVCRSGAREKSPVIRVAGLSVSVVGASRGEPMGVPRRVSHMISESRTDLMGMTRAVGEVAGRGGSGTCTTGEWLDRAPRTDPPNGLI